AHDHDRRALRTARPAQNAVKLTTFVRYRDARTGRIAMRQRDRTALDYFVVCPAHFIELVHEHELAEVVAQCGTREMACRRRVIAVSERSTPELFVDGRALRPDGTPFVPVGDRSRDLIEVGHRHAGRDEPRPPV